MEYKREEIIAGLECWLDPNSDLSCEDCAFFGKESDGGKCKAAVLREALALITSQEQRIKELTEELDDAKRDTIPKLRWSLERANAMGVEADKTIEKLTVENERLRNLFGKDILDILDYAVDKNRLTKSDTAKKIHFEIKRRCIEGGIYPAFVASVVEQVAKEITDEAGE